MTSVMRRLAFAMLVLLAGCGSNDPQPPTATTPAAPTEATATAKPVKTPTPKLSNAAPCTDVADATCYRLKVPLDRSDPGSKSVSLRVAVSGKPSAPVFVMLSGGPGEAGVFLLKSGRRFLGESVDQVRLVSLDQRGTGRDALDCPALQDAMGASDLTPPPAKAVTACATRLGDDRRFYTTRDTVADIEALRIALKADKLALDGTSYGTFVAQRYALSHPERVSGLVLDSVVPSEGAGVLSEVSIKATRRVMGEQTSEQMAKVIKEHHNGPALLDILTGLSVGKPRGKGPAGAIAAAANGNMGPLDGLIKGVRDVMQGWGATRLSQGLHASTLCADIPAPWGTAAAPLAGRKQALEDAAHKLSEADLYPYDRATATGNGIAQQCLNWPPVDVPPPAPAGELPDVPTLFLAGEKDLSTPMEWAQRAVKHSPHGKLIVVANAGHGVQSQGDAKALEAVRGLVASLE
jgi:pimeloyl-ACP methyl ester carboxylesterase